MSRFKRTQAKYVKKTCRVRNWAAYEAGLRSRGSLTVWISLTDGKLANWDAPRRTKHKAGRPATYSNHAIETMVILGLVFHLASRQTEGFLRSLFVFSNSLRTCLTTRRSRGAKHGWAPCPSVRIRAASRSTF